MASVFRVKYIEQINKEDGDELSKTVAARDAEHAISKVRKAEVGTWWDDDNPELDEKKASNQPKKVRYTITGIAPTAVEKLTGIDIL